MKIRFFGIILLMVLLAGSVNADLDRDKQDRLDFGYVINVKSISTEPSTIAPGGSGQLKITLENNANFRVFDLRLDLTLPDGFSYLNDVSRRRLSRLESGELIQVSYAIIAFPNASEGVYEASYSLSYLNHVATERTETENFGMIIKGDPKIFAQIEESGVYQGQDTGTVTIKFINAEVADVKFMTIELLDSEDYKVLSNNLEYVGDLDSDDYESVDFKINVISKKEEVPLKLKLDYKDSLNNDHSEDLRVVLEIRTPEELGIESNGTLTIVIVVIVVLVLAYYLYRRWKKKKKRRDKT